MKYPIFSLIITTKNEELVIEDILKSIKKQTYKFIEVIVIDNNSSDRTKTIAKKYTSHVYNKGPERSAQRNFGAKKAKGKYLIFLDADMQLSLRVVEACAQQMKRGYAGLVIPEKSIGVTFWSKCKALERACYVGDSTIEAARCFRKDIFEKSGGYDESITGPEDWDLPQRIAKIGKIGRISEYILHNEGKLKLTTLMKKKYYYGKKASRYVSKHRKNLTITQTIYILRPAFYRNWKMLLSNPMFTFGMVIMLFAEQLAGGIGFLEGRYRHI